MADMHHEIRIDAPPERVFDALATQKGLRGWWTEDSTTGSRAGDRAEFGFDNRGTIFHMQIDELQPARRLVWTCLGDPAEWEGTRLSWELSPAGGATTLHFTHGGWSSTDGYFAMCNSTWGELMYRLKAYVESGTSNPHWTE